MLCDQAAGKSQRLPGQEEARPENGVSASARTTCHKTAGSL